MLTRSRSIQLTCLLKERGDELTVGEDWRIRQKQFSVALEIHELLSSEEIASIEVTHQPTGLSGHFVDLAL